MQITAANQFTSPIYRRANQGFDVSVSGTFSATVTVQLSKDGATDWKDASTATAPTVLTTTPATAWFIRAGVKAGAFTSGPVKVEVHE